MCSPPIPKQSRGACDNLLAQCANRIKEQFVLFADRVCAATVEANRLRLYLSVIAYSLVRGLRRLGCMRPAGERIWIPIYTPACWTSF